MVSNLAASGRTLEQQILFNEAELFSGLVSAKRKVNERAGLHAWHPYYAGYSESFIKSAIGYLSLDHSHLILDPWNGSGTTGLVASKFGVTSIGFDINPAMTIFAQAKNAIVLKFGETTSLIKEEVIEVAKSIKVLTSLKHEALRNWFSDSLTDGLLALWQAVEDTNPPESEFHPILQNRLPQQCRQTAVHPLIAVAKSALFITARQLGKVTNGSNPTWTRVREHKPEYSRDEILVCYSSVYDNILADLRRSFTNSVNSLNNLALGGDARELPLQDCTVDAVITSPPYLTRIDYAVSTSPELLIMGDADHLRSIREMTMGAPVIVDRSIETDKMWGALAVQLVHDVENHSSKAAKSYYMPNMKQYFRDAALSLSEILRVLKPSSTALIVVQSSYFKEHEINLGDIYVQMAKALGAQAKIARRETVKGHMAHVNLKSSHYKASKTYFEDVVEIRKVPT